MKLIAIQWAKWLWKDTLAEKFNANFENKYKRYAFWDVLKKLTFDKNQEFFNKLKDIYDFDYLEKDIKDFQNNNEWIMDRLYNSLEKEDKDNLDILINMPHDSLNENDKLYIIEYFKNIPELRTRIQVQTYSNFIKNETKDIGYFSNYLIKKIKEENNNKMEYIINTDTRFLIESLDLLINNFILIKLKNNSLLDKLSNKIHHQHMSELELWLNKSNIWIEIDTFDINNKDDKYNRKSVDDIYEKMMEELKLFKHFKWYKEETIKKLKKIKNKLKKDKKYQELVSLHWKYYSNLYKKDINDLEKSKLNNKLLKIYKEYNNYIQSYTKNINNTINNDLFNNKLNKLNKFPKIWIK